MSAWSTVDPRRPGRTEPAHGTRSRYLKGCRCEGCTSAERHYKRRYRERRYGAAANPDTLAVSCWCEATTVRVDRKAVLEGMTASCGDRWCAA